MELYALMEKVHQGDKEAFSSLYSRYNNVVYRIAYNATNDGDLSLQIVKDVFRIVYQTLLNRGPVEGDFYGWLDALTATELRKRLKRKPSEEMTKPSVKEEAPVVQQVQTKEEAQTPSFSAPRKIRKIHAAAETKETPAESSPFEREVKAIPEQLFETTQPRPVRHYTPEQARAIEERVRARLEGYEPEPEETGSNGLAIVGVICGSILCAAILWVLAGFLMRAGILPKLDLGYSWFNRALFPLF